MAYLEIEAVDRDPYSSPKLISREEITRARLDVTRWVYYGYLGLVGLQIVVPLILLGIFWQIPTANTSLIRDIRDLVIGLSPALAGLGGLAGVAVGYYFK